jgi:hypothetical protein
MAIGMHPAKGYRKQIQGYSRQIKHPKLSLYCSALVSAYESWYMRGREFNLACERVYTGTLRLTVNQHNSST